MTSRRNLHRKAATDRAKTQRREKKQYGSQVDAPKRQENGLKRSGVVKKEAGTGIMASVLRFGARAPRKA